MSSIFDERGMRALFSTVIVGLLMLGGPAPVLGEDSRAEPAPLPAGEPATPGPAGEAFRPSAYHDPIRIDDDAGFVNGSGVSWGSGTVGDPYIIENWDIDGTGNGNCVYIGNTTAHFQLRYCTLAGASGDGSMYYRNAGVLLLNVTNGTVTYNTVSGCADSGMIIDNSSGNQLAYNVFSGNSVDGLKVNGSSNVAVYNNFTGNLALGVNITSGTGNSVHHNNFRGNNGTGVQAGDDGTGNGWDDLIGKGNYWDDYETRYPAATHDWSVWDTPYAVNGLAADPDDYPLVFATMDPSKPQLTDHTLATGATGNTFTFNATATDPEGVYQVTVEYWYGTDYANATNVTMSLQGGFWQKEVVLKTDFTGQLKYNITVVDTGGNWVSTGEMFSSITDDDAPTLDADDSPGTGTTGDGYDFNVTVSDNIGVLGVKVNWTHGALFGNDTMTLTGGYWLKSIVLDDSVSDMTYRILADDSSANMYVGTLQAVTVTDDDRPSPVNDLSAGTGTTGDSFSFNITASDNIAVTAVNVDWTHGGNGANDSLVFGAGEWSKSVILDDSLDDMLYRVYVRDAAGNFDIGTLQTVTVTDNDIPSLDSDDSPTTGDTGDSFEFNFTVSDNIEVDTAWVNWVHGGLGSNDSLTLTNGYWLKTIVLDESISDLTYTVYVNDTSDNWYLGTLSTVPVSDDEWPYLGADLSASGGGTGDVFQFKVTAFDNVDVYGVWVNWTHGGLGGNVSLGYSAGFWTGFTVLDHDLAKLNYTIYLNDTSDMWYLGTPRLVTVTDNDLPLLLTDDSATSGKVESLYWFNVTCVDNIAIKSVSARWSHGTLGGNVSLSLVGGRWLGNATLDASIGNLVYRIYVNDTSDNMLTANQRSVSVADTVKPSISGDASPATGTTGDSYTFDVGAADNVGVSIVVVTWAHGALGGDKILTLSSGRWTGTVNLAHSTADMTYTVKVEDTSDNLKTGTQRSVPVTDNDRPAADAGADQGVIAGTNVTFNGTACTDNIGVVDYTWSFTYGGGLVNLTGEAAWFTFSKTGSYNVTLMVRDAAGNGANDTLWVNVSVMDDEGPLFDYLDHPGSVGMEIPILISADVTDVSGVDGVWTIFTGTNGTQMNYTMSKGSGNSWSVSVPGQLRAGQVSFRVFAIDDRGNVAYTEVMYVTILDSRRPMADAGEDITIAAGDTVTFNGSGSTDNVGIVNYTWTFYYDGHQVVLYGLSADFTFELDGNYTVKLEVTDAAGNRGSDGIYVLVKRLMPGIFDIVIGPVLYDDGTPVTGAVFTMGNGTRALFQSITNDTGHVNFTAVPVGTYPAAVSKDGDSITFDVTVTDAGEALYTIPPFPSPAQELELKVGPILDEDGNPIEGALVTVIFDGVEYTGVTGPDGYATIAVPLDAAGQWITLKVSSPGREDLRFDTTARPDGELGEAPPAMKDVDEDKESGDGGDDNLLYIGLIVLVLVIVAVVILMAGRSRKEEAPPTPDRKDDLAMDDWRDLSAPEPGVAAGAGKARGGKKKKGKKGGKKRKGGKKKRKEEKPPEGEAAPEAPAEEGIPDLMIQPEEFPADMDGGEGLETWETGAGEDVGEPEAGGEPAPEVTGEEAGAMPEAPEAEGSGELPDVEAGERMEEEAMVVSFDDEPGEDAAAADEPLPDVAAAEAPGGDVPPVAPEPPTEPEPEGATGDDGAPKGDGKPGGKKRKKKKGKQKA